MNRLTNHIAVEQTASELFKIFCDLQEQYFYIDLDKEEYDIETWEALKWLKIHLTDFSDDIRYMLNEADQAISEFPE